MAGADSADLFLDLFESTEIQACLSPSFLRIHAGSDFLVSQQKFVSTDFGIEPALLAFSVKQVAQQACQVSDPHKTSLQEASSIRVISRAIRAPFVST